jgi:hypothetical protein
MLRRLSIVLLFFPMCSAIIQGQSAADNKIVRFSIPGSVEEATAEVDTPESRAVLEDFRKSKILARFHEALLTNDTKVLDELIADHVVWVAERFGKGENLTKAQVLAHFGSKKSVRVDDHSRDHVHFSVFSNAVAMTGNSTSLMQYKGQTSHGPRLFAIVFVKEAGQWRVAVHSIMDYDGFL